MTLKKQQFAEGEIAIFDEACIYKRGEYWQFRMWLPKENKYARKSLRTSSSLVALAKKMAKPEARTVTRTVAVPKTKIVTQEPQQQTTPKDTEPKDFTPIRPQPWLPNQQNDRDKR